jgi:hypothetical protein
MAPITVFVKSVSNQGIYEGFVRKSDIMPKLQKLFKEDLVAVRGWYQIDFSGGGLQIILKGDLILSENYKDKQILLLMQVNQTIIENAIDHFAHSAGWYEMMEAER